MTWPAATSAREFVAICRDEAALRPGVDTICRQLGLDGPVERFADGSLPVYAVGADQVLKIYPPAYAAERDREHLVLEVLAGRLPIPTPHPLGVGALEGWGWVWMERLRGESLATVWPEVADRAAVARAVGEAMAVLHAIDDPRLAALGDPAAFVAEQRRTAVDRQRARNLDPHWLAQIPAFLDGLELDGPPVLLHTEIMREHLRIDGSRLSGLFDFEPSRRGPAEYELSSVGLFVSAGDPALFLEILRGYGRGADDPELPRRVLGQALLHQYSNFPWYFQRVPPPAGARTLDDLASAWFGTA